MQIDSIIQSIQQYAQYLEKWKCMVLWKITLFLKTFAWFLYCRAKLGVVGQSSGSKQTTRVSLTTSPSKKTGSSVGADEGHGVSVADEETIMSHMDSFCARIKQILDVIHTLTQFNRYTSTDIVILHTLTQNYRLITYHIKIFSDQSFWK